MCARVQSDVLRVLRILRGPVFQFCTCLWRHVFGVLRVLCVLLGLYVLYALCALYAFSKPYVQHRGPQKRASGQKRTGGSQRNMHCAAQCVHFVVYTPFCNPCALRLGGGGVNSLCPAVPLYKEKAKTYNVSGNKIQPGTTRNMPAAALPHKEWDTAWVYWDMLGEDKEGEEEEEEHVNMELVELGNIMVDGEPVSPVAHRRGPALQQEPREDNVSVREQKVTIKKGDVCFPVTRASVTNVVSTNPAWALHCIASHAHRTM